MPGSKPARKYSQAGRLHSIIRLLETRCGMTLDELAEECSVDRRTIHRDLKAVEEAGYTLASEWQEGHKVYSFLTKSRSIPPITFTLPQLMSLYLLRSLAVHLSGTPFLQEIDDVFRGITSVLPDRSVAHLERIARVSLPILHGARDYSDSARFLECLQRALLHQYRLNLLYDKKGKGMGERYEIDPYTLIFHKGGLYLLGYAHNRAGMRLFALERIRGVEETRQRFDMPEGYRPEDHFKSAFGLVDDAPMNVRIRFSPEVSHAVTGRTWMPGQQLETGQDGGVTISFQASGMLELVSWILSYGMHAEVLEPPELRREVARQIREMHRHYGGREVDNPVCLTTSAP